MIEALISALQVVMSGTHLLFLAAGVSLGLAIGILPGLGGIAGLSLLLPFIYGMDPISALAMLIGLVARNSHLGYLYFGADGYSRFQRLPGDSPWMDFPWPRKGRLPGR